jgi:hypothetical protein
MKPQKQSGPLHQECLAQRATIALAAAGTIGLSDRLLLIGFLGGQAQEESRRHARPYEPKSYEPSRSRRTGVGGVSIARLLSTGVRLPCGIDVIEHQLFHPSLSILILLKRARQGFLSEINSRCRLLTLTPPPRRPWDAPLRRVHLLSWRYRLRTDAGRQT